MEERKRIQNKLDARQKLATTNKEELVALAKKPEEFDKFIDGLAYSMNAVFVCYAYQYNDIIRGMIRENMGRLEENEDLSQKVYYILHHLDDFAKESLGERRELFYQYEAVEEQNLGFSKLGITLKEFDKVGADYFRRMTNSDFDAMKSDKNYLATVSYLVKYHSRYMNDSIILPEIQKTLGNIDKKDFESKDDYKKFKRVASRTMARMTRKSHKINKEKAKTKTMN